MTKSSKRSTSLIDHSLYDVMIIGGGPAGMTALLWSTQLGLRPVLIEANDSLGGQLHWIYGSISNYPARSAKNGREMFRHFERSLKDVKAAMRLGSAVSKFDAENVSASLGSGEIINAKSAIIATGVRRRKLGIPGEEEFRGRGILTSGAKENKKVLGKSVAIIGGGDAALENALILSERASRVFVLHRRSELKARSEFIEQARRNRKIKFLFDSRPIAIEGDVNVRLVTFENIQSGSRSTIDVDAVLIRIGVQPNSELLAGQIALDKNGYVKVNAQCETNKSEVFAIGDVSNPTAPTIISAAGTAATAVKTILSRLEN